LKHLVRKGQNTYCTSK